jgi:phosphatidylglycerophosphate synthase
MDALMCSVFPLWWERMLFVGFTCLVLLFPFYIMPRKWLVWIGTKPFLSPNWITTHRILMGYLSYILYFNFNIFFGSVCLGAVGYALDAFDGIVARALGNLNPDKKGIGKVYDPGADKIVILPFVALMVWSRPILCAWLFWPLLFPEVAGILLRYPFVGSINRWVGVLSFVRDTHSGAKNLGKLKYLVQMGIILTCLPYDQHWLSGEPIAPNVLLACSVVMAWLSLVSKLRIHPRFDSAMDRINTCLDSFIGFFQKGGLRRLFRRATG